MVNKDYLIITFSILVLLALGAFSSVHAFPLGCVGRNSNLQESHLIQASQDSTVKLEDSCLSYSGGYLGLGTVFPGIANPQGEVARVKDESPHLRIIRITRLK